MEHVAEMNEYMIWKLIINSVKDINTCNMQEEMVNFGEPFREELLDAHSSTQQINAVFEREKHLLQKIIYKNTNQHRNAKYFKRMKQVSFLFILFTATQTF